MKWSAIAAQFSTARALLALIEDPHRPVIATSTAHSSKGEEWAHVLVVGVTEGYRPIYHVKPGAVEPRQQELNAMFVAITRTSKSLSSFHALRSHPHSRRTFEEPISFVDQPQVLRCMDVVELTD